MSHGAATGDDILPFLLFTLSIKKSEYPLSALTINLMNEILSREHYINIAAQLDHPSDAESLVDFIYHFLHHYSLSNQDLNIVDVKRRARRFMLAVISTMHGLALSNIPYDPDNYVFPLLLSILNNKPKSPITSILNKMTINLMTEILSKEGHVALIAQVDQASDAKNLLDFIPHILHYHSNNGSATIEMNRRAKQLMLGVIEKMRGEPPFNVPYDDPRSNIFPLLLYVLNKKEPESSIPVNALAIDLMSEILSRKDYITLAARINQVSDAKNLLDFTPHMLRFHSLPNCGSTAIDVNGRARQFMLAVISRMNGEPPSMMYDPHANTLPLLLCLLNNKESGPSIEINALAVDLLSEILSRDDYISLAARLHRDSRTEKLLEFIPYMFYDYYSASRQDFSTSTDMKRRAQRFMLELISKQRGVRPPSLIPDDPDAYILPLLLHFLNNSKKPRFTSSGLFKFLADLVRKILSRDDYVDLVARLENASDAEALLNFMLNILTHFASKSNPGPDAVDIVRRARRFILEIVVSKMWIGIPLSDDPYLTQSAGAFPFLLFLLDHFQKLGSEASVVLNPVTINLMNEILSRNDYIDFATLINKASRAKRLLDLLLEMLRHHSLSHLDPSTAWRARRFMLKVISKTPVIPPSLIVTGIKIPAERDYVGDGCFGQVFKGNLSGAVVALKVLHEPYDQAAFCREGLMWRSLKHKFLLPFLGIHEIEDPKAPQFFLVSPYMKNGTLSRWLMEADPPVTQIEERILEVAQGMEYIHSEGAVHGDIHGGNILLDDDLHAQIADFGLTLLSGGRSRTLVHPNRATSPVLSEQSDDDESLSGDTQMSDVYAFGSLCQDIQFENMMPLSPGQSDLEIQNLISQGALPHAWDVIQRCLADEPLERPTMRDVVESMMSISRYGSPRSSIYPETPRASLSPTPVLQCAG